MKKKLVANLQLMKNTKIYKRLNRDMQRNNYGLFIKKFKDFTNEAKAKKQKIKNGEITEEEYFKWLKDEDIKNRR